MEWQLLLGSERTLYEALAQKFELATANIAVAFFGRLRKMREWTVEEPAPYQTKEEASQARPLRKEGNSDTPVGCSGQIALRREQCGIFAQNKNCKTSRDGRCWETVGNRHVIAVTVAHATNRRTVEAVFSVQSGPRLHNEDQLPLLVSCEPVMGDCCEAPVGELSSGANS
jgi:hypothetical protein